MIQREQSRKRRKRLSAVPTLGLLPAEDAERAAEVHWRVSVVLMIPVVALLAVPLSRVNPRQGRFIKLIPGMSLCFMYVASLSGGKAAMERGDVPMEYGLWWIHGVFLAIALALNVLPVVLSQSRDAS